MSKGRPKIHTVSLVLAAILLLPLFVIFIEFIYQQTRPILTEEQAYLIATHPNPSNYVRKDGQYVAYANGVVKDTKTGLEWRGGADRDMNWYEARRWIREKFGGFWRMPTMDQLESLYQSGRDMTPLLKTTRSYVWSSEKAGVWNADAWCFDFRDGSKREVYRYERSSSAGVLAVRPP